MLPHALLGPQPKHLSHMAILVSLREEVRNMHVQLAAEGFAEATGSRAVPHALELVAALAPRVQRRLVVQPPVRGVHLPRGEPETGAVDLVEVTEDHQVQLGGEVGEGEGLGLAARRPGGEIGDETEEVERQLLQRGGSGLDIDVCYRSDCAGCQNGIERESHGGGYDDCAHCRWVYILVN